MVTYDPAQNWTAVNTWTNIADVRLFVTVKKSLQNDQKVHKTWLKINSYYLLPIYSYLAGMIYREDANPRFQYTQPILADKSNCSP